MPPPVDWPKFFQDLPETERELVIVVLKSGAEVAVARMLKFFETFMVIRGRLGGTDNEGHIFCLPYSQIEFVLFSRVQPDEMVVNMFGDIIGGIKRSFLTDPAEEEAKKKAEEEAAQAEQEAAEGGQPASGKAPPVNVSALRNKLLQGRGKRTDQKPRG